MSIKLHAQLGSMEIEVRLRNDAIHELVDLIQRYDETRPATPAKAYSKQMVDSPPPPASPWPNPEPTLKKEEDDF